MAETYGNTINSLGLWRRGAWSTELINNTLEVRRVDSAYTHGLDLLARLVPVAESAQDLTDTVDTDDVFGVLLGSCGIQRSNTEVVCAFLYSYRGLLDGRHGDSDDFIVSKKAACFSGAHVILTNMDAFAPDSEGNIDSVVNEEGDVVLLALFMKLLGCSDECTSVTCFVSILDDGHTWPGISYVVLCRDGA
jgi:hypothetical protein